MSRRFARYPPGVVRSRSVFRTVAVVVVATGALTACGASPPPAQLLATEIVGTLDVSDEVKDCMLDEIASYGEAELDEIAALAETGDARGIEQLDDFQASLAACR